MEPIVKLAREDKTVKDIVGNTIADEVEALGRSDIPPLELELESPL